MPGTGDFIADGISAIAEQCAVSAADAARRISYEQAARALGLIGRHRSPAELRIRRNYMQKKRALGYPRTIKKKLKLNALVWERDGGICQLCALPVPRPEMTLDRADPGGRYDPENLWTAHLECNRRKADQKVERFAFRADGGCGGGPGPTGPTS